MNHRRLRAPDCGILTSSEWEEARREISNQSIPSAGGGFGGGGLNVGDEVYIPTTSAEYDADKVEDLKKGLVTTLKNAAHIRKLKSDETVTVIVTGPGTAADGKWRKKVAGASPGQIPVLGDLPVVGELFRFEGGRDVSAAPAARLILRAKKTDAEAFQSSRLSFDEFRKQVTVMLY